MGPFYSTKRFTLLVAIWAGVFVASGSRSLADPGMIVLEPDVSQPMILETDSADPESAAVAPIRIDLSSATASAVVTGRLDPTVMAHYLVHGSYGQQLHVELNALPSVAYFSLYGVEDRRPYKPLATKTDQWRGLLPSDQDYLISVAATEAGADYMLLFELTQPSALSQLEPGPIRFPPNRSAAAVSGRVDARAQHHYVVQADAGDTVNVEMKASDPGVSFAIEGAEGGRVHKWLYDEARAWSFIAPTTQGYLLKVAAEDGPADYTLTVTVP